MKPASDRRDEGPFIATKEHRRFVEFANTVRRHRYIGLCHGPAGVGKTLSGRRYANWEKAEALLSAWKTRDKSDTSTQAALARSRTIFYTPTVGSPLRELRDDLRRLIGRVSFCIDEGLDNLTVTPSHDGCGLIELIVIDEAERLSNLALEYIRDLFDRSNIGLILVGMPGIEKRMARCPQFYSRVGFSHGYRPLLGDELSFVLTRHWRKLGVTLDEADFTDAQAVAAIARITGGNFRLLHRLFVQIERILRINEMTAITEEVVDAARSTLLIGAT